MKLFYTRKDFRDLVKNNNKKIEELEDNHKTELENLRKSWNDEKFNLMSKNDDLENKVKKLKDKCSKFEENEKIQKNILDLKEKNISEFIAKINELTNTVEQITKKFDNYRAEKEVEIADLKSDRYLKIECEPDKPGKTQKMQIYSKRRTSGIIKNVKEKL